MPPLLSCRRASTPRAAVDRNRSVFARPVPSRGLPRISRFEARPASRVRVDTARAVASSSSIVHAVVDASRGRLLAQGQGLLRGALLDPALPLDAKARAAAVGVLRRRCHDEGVVPYFCTGGFLLTPPYDADVDDVREGCERLRRAVEGWEF